MERQGYVSLWIGSAKSDDELWEYAQMIYTEDGDYLPSQFLKDFDIDEDEFDKDFMEQIYVDLETGSLGDFLADCSYDDVVIPEFEKLTEGMGLGKFHAGILLYNFQYDGRIAQTEHDNCKLRYVGSVEYREV